MTDVIRIPGFELSGNAATKREILHCIAKICDPLGLLASVILMGKLFLQTINQPWDEPLSKDLSVEWNHIVVMFSGIPDFSSFQIAEISNSGINQLLIFSDASKHCYATAVYLRSTEQNSVEVNLVLPIHD